MAAPAGGGFVEELPPNGAVRRQNPHMHLFEGLLALWECSRQERHLARTTQLFDLFATRFFRNPGVVGEYFTADLRPADGIVGRIVEPGHHHEWVWLLRRFEEASGRSVQAYVDALYGHADRYGFDADRWHTARRRAPHLAGHRGDQGEPGGDAAWPDAG